jgi:hypothetical protein
MLKYLCILLLLAASHAKLCCDDQCKRAISYGRTINRHIAEPQKRGEVEFLSFAQGSLVQVFAKDIGKDGLYWEAEITGRRGLLEKRFVAEQHVMCKDLQHEHPDPEEVGAHEDIPEGSSEDRTEDNTDDILKERELGGGLKEEQLREEHLNQHQSQSVALENHPEQSGESDHHGVSADSSRHGDGEGDSGEGVSRHGDGDDGRNGEHDGNGRHDQFTETPSPVPGLGHGPGIQETVGTPSMEQDGQAVEQDGLSGKQDRVVEHEDPMMVESHQEVSPSDGYREEVGQPSSHQASRQAHHQVPGAQEESSVSYKDDRDDHREEGEQRDGEDRDDHDPKEDYEGEEKEGEEEKEEEEGEEEGKKIENTGGVRGRPSLEQVSNVGSDGWGGLEEPSLIQPSVRVDPSSLVLGEGVEISESDQLFNTHPPPSTPPETTHPPPLSMSLDNSQTPEGTREEANPSNVREDGDLFHHTRTTGTTQDESSDGEGGSDRNEGKE